MEVIIYSFFIVSGAAGISYYVIKKRYSRLLEEEQEKAYSSRNNELQLASEKQKLESALKEKEHQLADVRTHEESRSVSLSGEVLAKDKQIQSLSAQLQKETTDRTTLEQKLSEKELKEKLLTQQMQQVESRSSSLHNDITSKEQAIQSLREELSKESALRSTIEEELAQKVLAVEILSEQIQQETMNTGSLHSDVALKEQTIQSLNEELIKESALRLKITEELSVKVRAIEILSEKIQQETTRAGSLDNVVSNKDTNILLLSSQLQQESEQRKKLDEQIQQEEIQRTFLLNEIATKEKEFQAILVTHSMEQQQLSGELHGEIENRKSIEERMNSQESAFRGTIQELEQRVQQLQEELSVVNNSNESLRMTREQYTEEFRQREENYLSTLSETSLQLTATNSELERTAELLQEQTDIRQATEHALQESKQKLYALINEQEQKLKEQTNAIVVLQSELAECSNDLTLAEQSIHNIIRLIPIPAFVVNTAGICEFCNSSLEQLVGYGMDELRDKHFSRFFPDEERSFFEDQWKNSVNRSEQFHGETNIVAATNDTISATMNIVEIQTNSSEKKFIGFLMDHTIEHEGKKHFTAAKERELELLNLKSRFIGMVSNQLRTSLVTIASNTELLERFIDKWSDERRYHSFLRINESIRQLIELVRDVTFTTRATTEPYSLTIAKTNLEALFQSTARELIADLESQHHFILSEQGDISSVPVDEKLVKTIAQQLLSNAFKYSRDKTEVKVHIEQNPISCVIKISDHGIGIPASDQKHLFSSFFRASNVSNIYGTGLGLTIVQQCVTMHNGSVSIESELHKGTTVTVSLPLSKNFQQ